jgi:F-type H+-transporting ATPase subunit b
MELVTPGLGLVFWMTIAFGCVILILRKFAWRPILGAIHQREDTIRQALRDSQRIQHELLELEEHKAQKLEEAQKEYLVVLARAKTEGEEILRKARLQADEEAAEKLETARKAIELEKQSAFNELKAQVALLSVDIAEKVLEEEFSDQGKYRTFVNSMLDKVHPN